MNRVFQKELPNDILSDLDMNRIYVTEDSRSAVSEYNCTSVSAIMAIDENKYIQYCIHIILTPQIEFIGHMRKSVEFMRENMVIVEI